MSETRFFLSDLTLKLRSNPEKPSLFKSFVTGARYEYKKSYISILKKFRVFKPNTMSFDNLNPPYGVLMNKPVKSPRTVLESLYAFSPNRETLGGTSYLIVENAGNILIDCPAWDELTQQFLLLKGVRWLFLTHRGGHGKRIKQIQSTLNCEVIVQEQEAYLIPECEVTTFARQFTLLPNCQVFWTPGHSPGSACLYWHHHSGILFCGRHLLPDRQGIPVPLRMAKTFHWLRQLRSVGAIQQRFNADTLHYLCPGANTGFLRGKAIIDDAYHHLLALDLEKLREAQAFL